MTLVQLETILDSSNASNAKGSAGASAALISSLIMAVILAVFMTSMGVSLLFGTASAAKTSTSLGSFVKNTLLNTMVAMSVITSLIITYLDASSMSTGFSNDDGVYITIPHPTNATFLVIFVLLAIIYKFVFPFDMGTRSKIVVHLLLFHVMYWGWSWSYDKTWFFIG